MHCFQALDTRSNKKRKRKKKLCELAVFLSVYFRMQGFLTDISLLMVSLFEKHK